MTHQFILERKLVVALEAILQGVTVAVIANAIFWSVSLFRSRWLRKENINSIRIYLEKARLETSFKHAKQIVESYTEEMRERVEAREEAWQYKLFLHHLSGIETLATFQSNHLRHKERLELMIWIKETRNAIDELTQGNRLLPDVVYERFWESLENLDWLVEKHPSWVFSANPKAPSTDTPR